MTSKEMQIQESITENQQRLTQHLIKQNKRYREALEFYADDYIWHEENMGSDYLPDYRCEAQSDGGKKARQALESESG